MKTTHASLLAVVSLSLALCACDSGDKKDTTSATPAVPKPPKAPAGDVKVNPPPPESNEPVKAMNPADASGGASSSGGSPTEAAGGTVIPAEGTLVYLNGLVQAYAQMQRGGPQMSGSFSGSGSEREAAIKKYREMQKKAADNPLTSLDQLVAAKLIKSIPEAPAGKKYVLDVKAQQVRLENK